MTIRNTSIRWFGIVVLFGIILSGCSFIRVQNVSEANVRVLVRTPDSNRGYTRVVTSGSVIDVFSSHGGRYTITTLPNEQYRALLNDLQQQVSERLFTEGKTLSAADVARLVERLNDIDHLLATLGDADTSCSGNVGDFDTAVAVVVWDETQQQWALTCS